MLEHNAADTRKDSLDEQMAAVYSELHRMAASFMRRERDGHTLQPTALVNEVYLRLSQQKKVDFTNRAQLLGISAQMMRRILVNYGEKRRSVKRGAEITILCLHDAREPADTRRFEFGLVDQVLTRLSALDERQGKVAELRIFGGMTVEETAEFLGVSAATISRDWSSARLWMARELHGAER